MLLTISKSRTTAPRSLLIFCVGVLALVGTASSQAQYTPPPPPLVTGPCTPTKKDPCTPPPASVTPAATPQRFPFPGEPPAAVKSDPSNPDAPQAGSPIKSFPFPGDPESTSKPAAPPAKSFPFPGEPESSSSNSSASSGSSDSSSSADAADETTVDGAPSAHNAHPTRAQRRLLPKVEDLDKRESEDLEVSKYYASTGNFLASYLRAQDAVKTVPDDPMAHFALAQSAGRLKKTDEAVAEYKSYLKLDPEGEKVKESQRALAELAPK